MYCLVVHFSTSWKKPYRFFADNYFSWLTRKGAYPVPPNTERYKQPEQIIGNKDLNALVASIKDVLIKDESVEVLFIDSNSNGYFDLRLCLYLYTHFHDAFINNRITYHTLIDEHWIDSLNADTVDYLIVNRDDWVASNDKYSQFRPLSHKEGPYLIMQKRSL